jgi:hypothetical protein
MRAINLATVLALLSALASVTMVVSFAARILDAHFTSIDYRKCIVNEAGSCRRR